MCIDGTPWINSIGATDPHDDSSSILSIDKKEYYSHLKKHFISIFDFLSFFYALWFLINVTKLGKCTDGIKKGRSWIGVIAREAAKNIKVFTYILLFLLPACTKFY